MGTYERKTREIKRSLNRRSRMRRAYFKMIGEDPKKHTSTAQDKERKDAIESGREINLSDVSDSEGEAGVSSSTKRDKKEQAKPEPKLTGRALARQKRAQAYHLQKEKEESIARAKARRDSHKRVMTNRTAKGQPRLGRQVGVLLDKLRKQD